MDVEIDKARTIVKRAVDLGVNFYDMANVYSHGRSEEIVGELSRISETSGDRVEGQTEHW